MDIKFSIEATGPLITTQILRFIAYESATPNAAVAQVEHAPPQVFPQSVYINVPHPVAHIVRIFSTPDSSPGTKLLEFLYDPTYTNIVVKIPIQVTVGSGGLYDPGAETNTLDISAFTDWDVYFERRAAGGKMASQEYTISSDKSTLTLVGPDKWADGEYIFICFNPRYTTAVPTILNSSLYSGIKSISASGSVDATFYGQLCEFAGPTANAIYLALQPLSAVSNMARLSFNTYTGAQTQVAFTTDSANPIKYKGVNYTQVIIGKNDNIAFIKGPDGYRIDGDISMNSVGLKGYHDMQTFAPNWYWMDGTGYPVADFPRFLWYFQSLPAGNIASISARGFDVNASIYKANCGRFCYDTDPGTGAVTIIYLPDFRGESIQGLPGNRGNDQYRNASSFAGSYVADQVGQFTLSFPIPRGDSYNGNPYDSVRVGRGQDSNPRSNITINTVVNAGMQTIVRNKAQFTSIYL